MRDATIKLWPTPDQRDLIDQAASVLGRNPSDFVLDAACDRARSVLLDRVCFRLDAEKFERFVALLDAPTRPSSGLMRLMAVKVPWNADVT